MRTRRWDAGPRGLLSKPGTMSDYDSGAVKRPERPTELLTDRERVVEDISAEWPDADAAVRVRDGEELATDGGVEVDHDVGVTVCPACEREADAVIGVASIGTGGPNLVTGDVIVHTHYVGGEWRLFLHADRDGLVCDDCGTPLKADNISHADGSRCLDCSEPMVVTDGGQTQLERDPETLTLVEPDHTEDGVYCPDCDYEISGTKGSQPLPDELPADSFHGWFCTRCWSGFPSTAHGPDAPTFNDQMAAIEAEFRDGSERYVPVPKSQLVRTDGGREQPRDESPWYCPECELWVGWKLDECVTGGHSMPRRPLRYDDVPFDDSHRVNWRHRLKAKLGLYGGGA